MNRNRGSIAVPRRPRSSDDKSLPPMPMRPFDSTLDDPEREWSDASRPAQSDDRDVVVRHPPPMHSSSRSDVVVVAVVDPTHPPMAMSSRKLHMASHRGYFVGDDDDDDAPAFSAFGGGDVVVSGATLPGILFLSAVCRFFYSRDQAAPFHHLAWDASPGPINPLYFLLFRWSRDTT